MTVKIIISGKEDSYEYIMVGRRHSTSIERMPQAVKEGRG